MTSKFVRAQGLFNFNFIFFVVSLHVYDVRTSIELGLGALCCGYHCLESNFGTTVVLIVIVDCFPRLTQHLSPDMHSSDGGLESARDSSKCR